jgi:mono/diheme cytochrome c family protein
MRKSLRFQVALAVVVSLASAVSFAQSSGEATYKTKCAMCHGATGMADTNVGKAMKVKPVTDKTVISSTAAQMIQATTNGSGAMKPFKDKLTDAQIKDSVTYFRSFIK